MVGPRYTFKRNDDFSQWRIVDELTQTGMLLADFMYDTDIVNFMENLEIFLNTCERRRKVSVAEYRVEEKARKKAKGKEMYPVPPGDMPGYKKDQPAE